MAIRAAVDGYAPGFADDALAMLTSRTAERRAAFFLAALVPGTRVLDVGCGPGTITLGLARAVAPGGFGAAFDREASQVELVRQAARRAGLEHLARPDAALAVRRPGAALGVCSSDWGGAQIEPRRREVDVALRSHLALRRRAGGDPYAGQHLPAWVEAAGFGDLQVTRENHVEMPYRTFARYIGTLGAAHPHVRLLGPGAHRGSAHTVPRSHQLRPATAVTQISNV